MRSEIFYAVMVLKRADKEQLVNELTQTLREAPAAVVASFRALPMQESMALRRSLRGRGGRARVVPKLLFDRVAKQLQWLVSVETADSILVAWTEGPAKLERRGGTDLLAPAKAVHEYVSAHKDEAKFLGGVLEGAALDGAAVQRLAVLPPLETLRGQFVSVLLGPLRGFLGVCHGVLRGLPAVLHAKAQA
ncbi:MAG: large subunit ribosomal protein L10 [Parcubacteria group bacterium Gr01-1014_38]|nr:MAG: large subunit ribosomal protein L10 [Parcubacteria group bacterium Gr01-1014_38]